MANHEFKDYIVSDILSPICDVEAKSMFGGFGIYTDGKMLGILTDDQMYFKARDTLAEEIEAKGGEQFIYTGHKNRKPTKMPWWSIPEELYDDHDLLRDWIDRAVVTE